MREIIIQLTDEGELIPLADLVRCKDCIHWRHGCRDYGYGIMNSETSEDDWCSYGERSEIETEI